MAEHLTDQEKVRRAKLDKLIAAHADPYQQDSFVRTHLASEFNRDFGNATAPELAKRSDRQRMAGRIMSLRQIGKVIFLNISDPTGIFQIYARAGETQTPFADITNLDLGDIIGIEGTAMRTKTDQLTLRVHTVTLLAKALKVLPSKFHGMKNIEARYRQRYLDLMINPEVKKIFTVRTQIIRTLQKILDDQGYLEVETPVLQLIHGGAAAEPFVTFHKALSHNFYLRIATELHLKRLVIGGIEKVYEIGRVFRNEGIDTKHNPEFTSIEIYTAYANMAMTMALCEQLIKSCVKKVFNQLTNG